MLDALRRDPDLAILALCTQMQSATDSIAFLAFGHIPKARGGRQQSGLANAMWSLAKNMNSPSDGSLVTFCATDIYEVSQEIDNIPVIGWTWHSLLLSILRQPIVSLSILFRLSRVCYKYKQPIVRTALRAFLLRAAIDKVQPTYVHLHTCQAVVFLEAGIADPSKTFVTIHGIFGAAGPDCLARMEAALTQIPIKLLGFVTTEIATVWQTTFGLPRAPVAVVPNSYDTDEFFLPDRSPTIKGGKKTNYKLVTVGSVSSNKGQLRVVDALVKLLETDPPYKIDYTVVGQSAPVNLAGELSERAVKAGIEFLHIDYLLPSKLRQLLLEADYMILASESEGFGLVFLESIACGTPVVLPKDLPICREPGIISCSNSVLLESCSVESILEFLKRTPEHAFISSDVSASLPTFTWEAAGRRYRDLLSAVSSMPTRLKQ